MNLDIGDLVVDTYPQWCGVSEDIGVIIDIGAEPESNDEQIKYHVAWMDVETGGMFFLWETTESIKKCKPLSRKRNEKI